VAELAPNAATSHPGGWELVREVAAESRLVEIAVPENASQHTFLDSWLTVRS